MADGDSSSNKVWLDSSGRVLIDTSSNVYYASTCCCGGGKCFQRYEASCTSGSDGWSDWTSPAMLEYTCARPAVIPDVGSWIYAGKTAYKWISAGSCGSECEQPVDVPPPEGLCTCILSAIGRTLNDIASYMVYMPYIRCTAAMFITTAQDGTYATIGLTSRQTTFLRIDQLENFDYSAYDYITMAVGHISISQLMSYNFSADRYGLPVSFYSQADPAGYQDWLVQQSGYTHYQTWYRYGNSTYIPLELPDMDGYTFMYRSVFSHSNSVYSLYAQTSYVTFTPTGQTISSQTVSILYGTYSAVSSEIVRSYAKTWNIMLATFNSREWGSQHVVLNNYGNTHVKFSCYRHAYGVTSLPQNRPVTAISVMDNSLALDGSPEWYYFVGIFTDYPIDDINGAHISAAHDFMYTSLADKTNSFTPAPADIWPTNAAAYSYTRCASSCAAVITYCWGRACDSDGTVGSLSGTLCAPVVYAENVMAYPSGARIYGNYIKAHEQDDALGTAQEYRTFNSEYDGHVYLVVPLGLTNYPSWYISDQCGASLDPALWEVPHVGLDDSAFYCVESAACAQAYLHISCADMLLSTEVIGGHTVARRLQYPSVVCESNWTTLSHVLPVSHMAFPQWWNIGPLLNTYVLTSFIADVQTAGMFYISDAVANMSMMGYQLCPDVGVSVAVVYVKNWGLATTYVETTYTSEDADGRSGHSTYCASIYDAYDYAFSSTIVFSPTWLGNVPASTCMFNSLYYSANRDVCVALVAYQVRPVCGLVLDDICHVMESHRYITANILNALGYGSAYAWGTHGGNYCLTLHSGDMITVTSLADITRVQTRTASGGLSVYQHTAISAVLSGIMASDTVVSDVFGYVYGTQYGTMHTYRYDTCGWSREDVSSKIDFCNATVYRQLSALGECYPTMGSMYPTNLYSTYYSYDNGSTCMHRTENFCRDWNTTFVCPTTAISVGTNTFATTYIFSRYGKYADCYHSYATSNGLWIAISYNQ